MSVSIPAERLSKISTLWTALTRRESGPTDDRRAKAVAFVERYQRAVYGYLLKCVHDPDKAAELFQEFALRFLRGDFRNADPEKGRFRDYLRTVLINLVRQSRRAEGRPAPTPLIDEVTAGTAEPPTGAEDEIFLAQWRETILGVVWQSLEADQNDGGPPYHALLRARAERPDDTSEQLAAALTALLRPEGPFTDTGVRKLLQRGREEFSDRVVDEVARSIASRDADRVTQELIDLGFFGFCRKALDRWRRGQ